MSEKKDGCIRVNKSDINPAKKIMRGLGCRSMKELFHKFIKSYHLVDLRVYIDCDKNGVLE